MDGFSSNAVQLIPRKFAQGLNFWNSKILLFSTKKFESTNAKFISNLETRENDLRYDFFMILTLVAILFQHYCAVDFLLLCGLW